MHYLKNYEFISFCVISVKDSRASFEGVCYIINHVFIGFVNGHLR